MQINLLRIENDLTVKRTEEEARKPLPLLVYTLLSTRHFATSTLSQVSSCFSFLYSPRRVRSMYLSSTKRESDFWAELLVS